MSTPYGPGDLNAPNDRFGGNGMVAAPHNGGYGGYQYSPDVSQQTLNYPPPHHSQAPSYLTYSSTALKNEPDVNVRYISRTPSPTPSEAETLSRKGVIDWNKLMSWKYWIRKEWIWYYVIAAILFTLVILISVYDKQIVHFLKPTAQKIQNLPAGWVIPIAIFFIISFPPLFGHEILAILCGVVWGLWIGFAITAAGTLLGEIGNFYAFKYCCRARGEKLEKSKIQYACLARIVREGGFKIALVARYSAMPGHFTTAIFSTCGMNIFVFILAATLSLPKQFIIVYIGVIVEEAGDGNESTKDKILSYAVAAATIGVTFLAMWYLLGQMEKVKSDVIYQRRKARQAKLDQEAGYPYAGAEAAGSNIFNPRESESELPLNPSGGPTHQHWDSQGNAIGYVSDPRLHAPTPQRPISNSEIARIPTYRKGSRDGSLTLDDHYVSPAPPKIDMRQQSAAASVPRKFIEQRQESVDSVSWDMTNQGMGGDAYKLPAIQPHTPLSGGFADTGPDGKTGPSPRYQSSSGLTPQLQASAVDPFASTEHLGSGVSTGAGPVPPPLQALPANSHIPTNQSLVQSQPPPLSLVPGSSSDATLPPGTLTQSPTQYAMAYSSPGGPSSSDLAMGPLPSPQFTQQKGQAPDPQNFYASPGSFVHAQGANDANAYYPAPHPRVVTEAEALPPAYRPTQ